MTASAARAVLIATQPGPPGALRRREASVNDVRVGESERRTSGPGPEAERGQPLRLE